MTGTSNIPPNAPPPAPSVTMLSLSGAVSAERMQAGAARLRELGFSVAIPAAATASWRYFAGTDDERAQALDEALESSADIVLFSRGGYGLSRILHRVDWHAIARSRKVFCGFSDVTAFSLAALARANFVSFAGPVGAGEFAQTAATQAREFTELHFLGLLKSPGTGSYIYPQCTSDISEPATTIDGTLWGTNLAMITHLVGTPFMPHIDDGILVLEDIGEAPYRVERMFWQLKLAGILDRQRAIILGAFTDCEPADGMHYPYAMREAIDTLREIAPCPVLTRFPFGHVPAKVTLPIGAPATLRIDGSHYTLSVRDYLAPRA